MNDATAQKAVQVIPPQAIKNNASFTTVEIDTLGYNFLKLDISLGATDIALTVLKLQESDVSGSGYTDITSSVFGGTGNAALPSATNDNGLFSISGNLIGHKRYLSLVVTVGSGSTGAYVSAVAYLSKGSESPADAGSRGLVSETYL